MTGFCMKATMTFDGLSELIQIKVTVNFTNCSVTSITTWNNSAGFYISSASQRSRENLSTYFVPMFPCFISLQSSTPTNQNTGKH